MKEKENCNKIRPTKEKGIRIETKGINIKLDSNDTGIIIPKTFANTTKL